MTTVSADKLAQLCVELTADNDVGWVGFVFADQALVDLHRLLSASRAGVVMLTFSPAVAMG